MKNYFKIFLCLFLLFTLNNCSIGMYFYVKNSTSEDQKIVLTFSPVKKIKSFYGSRKEEPFQHNISLLSSKVTRFKDFKKAQDKVKIDYAIEGENKISVVLPANSLTNIDSASNDFTDVIEIEYIKNNETMKLTKEQFMKMVKFEKLSAVFELN